MINSAIKWLRIQINWAVNSIAFLPAIIAVIFLTLSYIMITFDYSDTGKDFKSQWDWLSLKDASTARSIISTIAAGILSLTVFSFSMVMIILNQAASNLSNRVLDKLIGNRFQQVILGFYIGTIVYALFLLSTIRDIDSGIYVPALSTYLLIFFTVFDIILFIYFLHYITQSVKYETIVHRIYKQTQTALEKNFLRETPLVPTQEPTQGYKIKAPFSGIFQGFDKNMLLNICKQEEKMVVFIYSTETYVLQGTPLLLVPAVESVPEKWEKQVVASLNIQRGEPIDTNYFYGFRQLMEMAVRALSPGINDPGTAILCLQALADLLAYRAQHHPELEIKDNDGKVRIIRQEKNFEEIFSICILPIWDYGKNDRLLQQALYNLLQQLQHITTSPTIYRLLPAIQTAIARNQVG